MKPIECTDYVIVACGTLSMELIYLRRSGILEPQKIFFTKPGRHEVPKELETQLVKRLDDAKKYSDNIVVIYGDQFCYINVADPARTIYTIINEQKQKGFKIAKIKATHCVDMLVSAQQREKITRDTKVLWLTPGWIKYRNFVFQDWDKGKANENFPKHTGGAILLDGLGFWDDYSQTHPERILEFSDWMGIPIVPVNISLDRFTDLITHCLSNMQHR